MEQRVSFLNSRGQALAGVLHCPDDMKAKAPIVIFAHGRSSGKGTKKALELARRLPGLGFAFLRFDFSGCGESEGTFGETTVSRLHEDLKAAYRFASGIGHVDRERMAVVGSSLGGMAAILALSEGMPAKTTVLISPAVDYGEHHRKSDEKSAMGSKYYADIRKRDFFELARSIKCPCLVIHGDTDNVCFLSGSKKLMESLPKGSRLDVIKGEGHFYEKPENFDRMISLTVEWLKKKL